MYKRINNVFYTITVKYLYTIFLHYIKTDWNLSPRSRDTTS